MHRVRVLHVLGGLDRGGAETWLVQVLSQLQDPKYQIDVLVFSNDEGAYEKRVRDLGARVLRVVPPSAGVRFFKDFGSLVRKYGPYDVVHSHVWLASGLVMYAAYLAGIPRRIVHSRNTNDRHGRSLKRAAYASIMRRLINRWATDLVGITKNAGEGLFRSARWAAEGRIIPTAIDCTPFCVTHESRRVRSELGISPDLHVIGHVGSFTAQKNHRFVLEILEALVAERPNVHMLLVGGGPLRESIERHAEELSLSKHITFAGLRDDVPALMLGAMDAFLFPSNWEGLGRVIVEAQAAGLPCIISDIVPEEADIVPGLIHRMSLSSSAKEWANAVCRYLDLGPPVPQSVALTKVQQSQLNIANTIGLLDELYTN